MILFYQPEIELPFHTLDREESGHIVRVLRLGAGDAVHLTDGHGLLCRCRIIEANPKGCTLEVLEKTEEQARSNHRLHLAVAPTKNISRYEWFLEKATEIGVDEVTPLICTNSERRVVKTDRLKKVMVAAMKQSLKRFLPNLHEPLPFERFIERSLPDDRFIAYISEHYRDLLKDLAAVGKDTLILIGPEGDFTEEEVETALKHGFRPVSLGSSRLRTETAALVACHTVELANLGG